MTTSGVALFARYAFPPNRLGYCGPPATSWIDGLDTLDHVSELRRVVSAFEGAYPYLELIAGCHGLDPLDRAVVEAYWVGNDLLDRVDTLAWGNSMEDRFRPRAGQRWSSLAAGIDNGQPNHAFHVFCAYPWVGMLRDGHTDAALHVIDQCRIRWGRVVETSEGTAIARSEPIVWDGRILLLGPPAVESVSLPIDAAPVRAGDIISMHWDYMCDVLTDAQVGHLRAETIRHLAIANAGSRNLAGVIED